VSAPMPLIIRAAPRTLHRSTRGQSALIVSCRLKRAGHRPPRPYAISSKRLQLISRSFEARRRRGLAKSSIASIFMSAPSANGGRVARSGPSFGCLPHSQPKDEWRRLVACFSCFIARISPRRVRWPRLQLDHCRVSDRAGWRSRCRPVRKWQLRKMADGEICVLPIEIV